MRVKPASESNLVNSDKDCVRSDREFDFAFEADFRSGCLVAHEVGGHLADCLDEVFERFRLDVQAGNIGRQNIVGMIGFVEADAHNVNSQDRSLESNAPVPSPARCPARRRYTWSRARAWRRAPSFPSRRTAP